MRIEELLSVPLRLRHAYVAAAIADRGSVRDASDALFLTQPGTSRSLRELEETLGLRLFDRTPHGMDLTAAGKQLLPHLQLITSEVGAMMRHAAELQAGEGGEVRVGTVLAGSARLLPDAVIELKRQNPDIGVRITEATPVTLHKQLMLGELDLIVGRTQPIASLPGVEVEVLHDDSVTVLAGSDHPRAGSADLAGLVDEPWILPPPETSLRQQVDSAFVRQAGRSPLDVIECVSPIPIRRMLIYGRRIAAIPAWVFADDLDRGDLVRLPIEIEGSSVPVGIITRVGGELPSSVGKFVAFLRSISSLMND